MSRGRNCWRGQQPQCSARYARSPSRLSVRVPFGDGQGGALRTNCKRTVWRWEQEAGSKQDATRWPALGDHFYPDDQEPGPETPV